jgi:uncharacterized membrane protein
LDFEHLNDNVETLASLHQRAQRSVSRHQRLIESFTAHVGRPRSFYVVLSFATAWTIFNLESPRFGLRALDPPPFNWLQGVLGFCALLMTLTILTTQNRQTHAAEQRAQLELQVSLLAEQKVAKLIALVEELRRDMPAVKNRVDEVAEVMQEPVDPFAIISALEHTLEEQAFGGKMPDETLEPEDLEREQTEQEEDGLVEEEELEEEELEEPEEPDLPLSASPEIDRYNRHDRYK